MFVSFDCNHVFDIEYADRYMDAFIENVNLLSEIRIPSCPVCGTAIRKCRRYIPVLNKIHRQVNEIKRKANAHRSKSNFFFRKEIPNMSLARNAWFRRRCGHLFYSPDQEDLTELPNCNECDCSSEDSLYALEDALRFIPL